MFVKACMKMFTVTIILLTLNCKQPKSPSTSEWIKNCDTVLCLVTQSCLTVCEHIDCSLPGSFDHGDSLGKNTGLGYHALLQIFSQPGH